MSLLLIAASLFAGPSLKVVDRYEYNECYSREGVHQFNQVILYRWSAGFKRYIVSEFFIVTCEPQIKHNRVRFRHANQDYEFLARSMSRTRTAYDPEVENRKLVGCDERLPYLEISQ